MVGCQADIIRLPLAAGMLVAAIAAVLVDHREPIVRPSLLLGDRALEVDAALLAEHPGQELVGVLGLGLELGPQPGTWTRGVVQGCI